MKKKILSFIFAICLILPSVFLLSACGNVEENGSGSQEGGYTVSEAEWEMNFAITKVGQQLQAQEKMPNTESLWSKITSYTLTASGTYIDSNDGETKKW